MINKYFIYIVIILVAIISFKINASEDKIVFKLNNKSFTTIDIDTRTKYLEFIGDNSNIEYSVILEDFISAIVFYEYYLNSNIKINTADKVEEIYNNILNEIDSKIPAITKEKIIYNLELDYIRKMILEDSLNEKRKEIFSKDEKNELIYKYKISYISFKLEEFVNLNKNIEEFNFNNLEEVKLFLNNKKIIYFEKQKEIQNINKINNDIKNNIEKNNFFFRIINNNIISYVNIKKSFETYDGLIAKIYSLESDAEINKSLLKCDNLKINTNSVVKEYEFHKLNNEIKENLLNINDYIAFSNQNKITYVILCDIKFNEEILNNISINKKIQNLVDNIENNFIKKYSKQYNLINFNE